MRETHTFERLIHSRDSYMRETHTFERLIHSRDSYILETHTFKRLIHSLPRKRGQKGQEPLLRSATKFGDKKKTTGF